MDMKRGHVRETSPLLYKKRFLQENILSAILNLGIVERGQSDPSFQCRILYQLSLRKK